MELDPNRPLVRFGALALGALIAVSITTGAWAQWVWRDGKGQTHASDLPPPPSVSDGQIIRRPAGGARAPAPAPVPQAAASAAPPASAAGKGVEPQLEAKRRKAEEEEAAKRKAEDDKQKAARAESCTRAQAHMRVLNDGVRMARVNEKGEREILDDAARAAETKRTREVIASDCGK